MRINTALLALLAVLVTSTAAQAVPIQSLPNLVSVSVFERTGPGPDEYVFLKSSAEITTRRADPLTAVNSDIATTASEFLDVYYSDADGTLDVNGAFLTIDGVFDNPADTGENIAEVRLNFSSGPFEHANVVTRCVTRGAQPHPEDCPNAIDGDLQTHTNLGNTDPNDPSLRLSVTVGFASTAAVPGPPTWVAVASGLVAVAGLTRLRRK